MTDIKPNILLIISDQHTPAVLGCYGNKQARTPHLDRLASEGVVFDNVYCPSPICVASRLSFLSGRHPSQIGVWGLGDTFASTTPTWPLALTLGGWHTYICGRMHLAWGDRNHGFETRLCGDRYPTIKNHFEYWDQPTVPRANLVKLINAAGPGSARHDAEDAITEGHALKFFHEHRYQGTRPFAMCVGFYRPHTPFCAPEEHLKLFDNLTLDFPPSNHPIPEIYQSLLFHYGLLDAPPSQEAMLRAAKTYYAMVYGLDQRIGKICQVLEDKGLWDDTIIIYTSDHGETLGRHGLWFKSNFYEESVKVPLIIRYPRRFGKGEHVSEPVSLLDIFPTFCELGGIEPYEFLDGHSLLGALEGNALDESRPIFAEYCAYGIHTPMRMVRRGPLKMVYADGFPPLLYDLDRDPDETTDISQHPDYRTSFQELLTLLLTDWNPDDIRRRVLQNQRNRDLFVAAEDIIRKATHTHEFPWR